jgi:hypothetical protein
MLQDPRRDRIIAVCVRNSVPYNDVGPTGFATLSSCVWRDLATTGEECSLREMTMR